MKYFRLLGRTMGIASFVFLAWGYVINRDKPILIGMGLGLIGIFALVMGKPVKK